MSDEGERLRNAMDSLEDRVRLTYASCEGSSSIFEPAERVTVVLSFAEKGFGFGEVRLKQVGDEVFLDTEHMGLEHVRRFFDLLLGQAILDIDERPERHLRYNGAMGRSCSTGCAICFPK